MTVLQFFDCSEDCNRIVYYDCDKEINLKKRPSRHTTCDMSYNENSQPGINLARQQRILNTVRISNGQYLDNLASLTVRGDATKNQPTANNNYVNESQASDRRDLSVQRPLANPRLRPGNLAPGGVGVDVKHNSFHRILARKKAQHIRTDSINSTATVPKYGNKTKAIGIVNQLDCRCSNRFSLSFF